MLPAVLCVFIIYITNLSIEYYPILFGLIIGLVNWGFHKKEPLLGVVFSILASYICFYLTFLSMYFVGSFFELIKGNINHLIDNELIAIIAFSISPFVVSPILLFFAYKFIFNFPKKTVTFFIIISAIILLFAYNIYINFYYESLLNNRILNPYTIWQVVMALAIQLIIYQKIIWTKQKPE